MKKEKRIYLIYFLGIIYILFYYLFGNKVIFLLGDYLIENHNSYLNPGLGLGYTDPHLIIKGYWFLANMIFFGVYFTYTLFLYFSPISNVRIKNFAKYYIWGLTYLVLFSLFKDFVLMIYGQWPLVQGGLGAILAFITNLFSIILLIFYLGYTIYQLKKQM